MVGGGQLSRMTHQATVALGVDLAVLARSRDDSAARVCANTWIGAETSFDDVAAFAKECDVLTFDHEHVPDAVLRGLEADGHVLRPGRSALRYAQDKLRLRTSAEELSIPCPRWRVVSDVRHVAELADEVGWPVVLKATRGGYDGRGVWVVPDADEAADVVTEAMTRGVSLIVEERVDFLRELSVQVARSPYGQVAVYPVVETIQVDGVCREVIAPAPGLAEERATEAQRMAIDLAHALDVTGMLAVEMFETSAGILVNELAMRPHNSGHWTMDGAVTSQFEQHLRAVLDLPLGSPSPVAPYAVMANVLGGSDPDLYTRYFHVMARDPGLRVHIYGKDVRPGRKIGHVNVFGGDPEELRERARDAAMYLRGERG